MSLFICRSTIGYDLSSFSKKVIFSSAIFILCTKKKIYFIIFMDIMVKYFGYFYVYFYDDYYAYLCVYIVMADYLCVYIVMSYYLFVYIVIGDYLCIYTNG